MMTFAESNEQALQVLGQRQDKLLRLRRVVWALMLVNLGFLAVNGLNLHRIDHTRADLMAKALEINADADELTARSADLTERSRRLNLQSQALQLTTDELNARIRELRELNARICAQHPLGCK